jgi:hypothetical protein
LRALKKYNRRGEKDVIEIGQVFGRLTVVGQRRERYRRQILCWCLCICGGDTVVIESSLHLGTTKSCGCLQRERQAASHQRRLREWQEAEPVTQRRDVAQEKITITTRKSETLKYIADNPSFSLAALATAMGWTLNNGVPYKTRAFRVVQTLINDRLVKQTRSGRYKVTLEGTKVLTNGAENHP